MELDAAGQSALPLVATLNPAELEQEEASFGETSAIIKGKHLTWIQDFALATSKRTLIVVPD